MVCAHKGLPLRVSTNVYISSNLVNCKGNLGRKLKPKKFGGKRNEYSI